MRRWILSIAMIAAAACAPNAPPEFLPLSPQQAVVGARFELEIQAYDPDGDRLSYGFVCPTLRLEDRARLLNYISKVKFTWTPLAGDVGTHQIDFTASDGAQTAVLSVKVQVKPAAAGETAPVFRKPLGEGMTLDIKQTPCVQLPVLVEDPDDTAVDLRQRAVIPGSTFKVTGGKSGTFTWCPTAAQAVTARWSLLLAANDHDNPPVYKDYIILITSIPPVAQACVKTAECPLGQVCSLKLCAADGCTPKDENNDLLLHEQGTCPDDHFCAPPGPDASKSHCAADCAADSDCRSGERCKVFDTQPGCGRAGSRAIGSACADFTECDGRSMCLSWKDGYCALSDCDTGGSFSGACPSGAACIPLEDLRFKFLGTHWVCLKICQAEGDCRSASGYSCKTTADDLGNPQRVCM